MFVFPHTFPVLRQSTFSMFLELYGFLLHKKNFKKSLALKYLFSHIFPLIWEFTFPIFWEFYGFLLHPKYLRNPNFGMFVFFLYFHHIMGIHVSHILGIVWISASTIFSYFSHTMEIHFSHIFKTAWISASSQKFKKYLTLKCLCFPILFPYYGNSLFSYFGNCME